ncbi:MAG: CDP-diacylglycerol--glycerol-3-phosphate 3-phosphatidyltransferase [Coriobacteriia bacterium]|nr:CDP-diacylglycerol--glycerol-3-phosphate 3-phosphatidyltransferase [Coriobacteriia bacterium]MCL2750973.1 CDP-diacylglycerol--glycerol-3-phosphate 3-phosphatidyltransferase [Coriobacteriia bacterium]
MAAQSYKQILTPANIVTTIRIALVPIFVGMLLAPWPSWFPDSTMRDFLELIKPWLAAGVFALLAFTDSVDGYLARSRNEITTLGKFLDPLADKILVAAALLALVELQELPTWVVLVIIAREFLVSGLRMVVSAEGHVIAASPLGKVKTVVQVIAIILFIIKSSPNLPANMGSYYYGMFYLFSWAVMLAALLFTVFSMVDYFYKASKVLALPFITGKKASAPKDSKPLAKEIIEKAQLQQLRIGTAESCTGGLVAKRMTDVPGSSEVFNGSIVSYSNEVKTSRLGVSPETLGQYGAVSEQTAREMAEGALTALGVDLAVSTTGIAGPEGGSEDKPVGTVWVGIAFKNAKKNNSIESSAEAFDFEGNRTQVRAQATNEALAALCKHLS